MTWRYEDLQRTPISVVKAVIRSMIEASNDQTMRDLTK